MLLVYVNNVLGEGWGCLESQTRLVQTKEVYVILVIPQELGWGRLEEKFSSASPPYREVEFSGQTNHAPHHLLHIHTTPTYSVMCNT